MRLYLMHVLGLVGLLVAVSAVAAPATSTLSWVAPAERVDGTPLAASEILAYRVYYAVDADPTKEQSDPLELNGGVDGATVTLDLQPRASPYSVRFAVTAVDVDGLESALSPIASKEFVVRSTANPAPPTTLLFTIECGDGCTIQPL